jgi:SAM-dependent methyltransferase
MRIGKENVLFRTEGESNCEVLTQGILSADEWKTDESLNRIFESSWDDRYEYESDVITQIIKSNNVKNIIELGSGPGVLCNKILMKNDIDMYHLVDIEAARAANEKEKLGGTFHVRDLNNGLEIDLPNKIDLFIANDFLEHIQNPAKTLLDIKKLMTEDALAFISVPNWRMGHAWIYRGLFDWDNFIHFMWQHGFAFETYADSPLKCQYSSKLDSERSMPDELINSWNFYIVFKRNDNE